MSAASLEIRAATPKDGPGLTDLWRACDLLRPWNDPAADFRQALEGPSSTVLVVGEPPAASVMVGYDGHRGWVYYVAVDPNRRGEGLGRAMMAAAEGWLATHGVNKARLMVRASNDEAVGFYQALGYDMDTVRVMRKDF